MGTGGRFSTVSQNRVKMKDRIVVYVNDSKVAIYVGMQVRHALIACNESLYAAARNGEIAVTDESGFHIGLDGSLQEGARLYTKPIDP
ncbi:MAG: hypothetical protein JXR85_06255 [Deltaproteobacteria bacterium]|nr:hypothetical protein [Deltaproteobacteria bacterium]